MGQAVCEWVRKKLVKEGALEGVKELDIGINESGHNYYLRARCVNGKSTIANFGSYNDPEYEYTPEELLQDAREMLEWAKK